VCPRPGRQVAGRRHPRTAHRCCSQTQAQASTCATTSSHTRGAGRPSAGCGRRRGCGGGCCAASSWWRRAAAVAAAAAAPAPGTGPCVIVSCGIRRCVVCGSVVVVRFARCNVACTCAGVAGDVVVQARPPLLAMAVSMRLRRRGR